MTDDNDDLWRSLAVLDEAEDFSGALDLALHSELKDDPRGQRYVGWVYATRNDFVAAGSWYLKAARQGSEEAFEACMDCLGYMWRAGFQEQALALAESAPLSSRETFQRFLMSRYFDLGNQEKLLEWSLRLAAFGKDEDVMYVARLLISRGSPEAAVPYLEAAADRGSPAAHQLLGELYRRGTGVEQDELKANQHYRESARHGYILSQTRLLHFDRAMKGSWHLPMFAVRLLSLMARTVVLNSTNPRDPRLSDLPASMPTNKCP